MIIRNIPLRHELKYFITPAELNVLRSSLTPLMQLDQGHEYHIRSLYFDTINDDALEEKIAGVGNRKKYRIRIYNFSDRMIKLECKSKYGDLISKQSVSIPRELADQLIAGDPEGLQRMRHPLLHDVYREMKTRLLRPVVIVDYVREAYIHPAEEVRITFDKQIRTGLYQTAMFDASIPTYPVFDDPVEVLEVKYDEFLPTYMQAVLSGITAQRSAVSKYTWCRRYENKEFYEDVGAARPKPSAKSFALCTLSSLREVKTKSESMNRIAIHEGGGAGTSGSCRGLGRRPKT